jgi:membrane protein
VRSAASRGHRLVDLARSVWAGIGRDDVAFYAAGVAFHSLFSGFAALFLLALLLSSVGADPANLRALSELLRGLVPDEATEFVGVALEWVSRPPPSPLLPLSLLFTFWTASNVVQALIHALNRIYHLREEARAPWRSRLMALAVVGSSVGLFVSGVALLLYGRELGESTASAGWLRGLISHAGPLVPPLAVIAVFGGALLLYWLAPSFKHARRVSWPGACVFAVAWILATFVFNLYLRHVAVIDRFYGPLATVVVVLTWVYLSAYLLLVGGEVNAALGRRERRPAPAAPSAPAAG